MDHLKTLKALQLFYAGALVDAARHYAEHGVLEAVTAAKRREQELSATEQIARLGIRSAEDIFSTYTELFGCADWEVEHERKTLRAETRTCLACALAKKLGARPPARCPASTPCPPRRWPSILRCPRGNSPAAYCDVVASR